jgi:hypothetical protein
MGYNSKYPRDGRVEPQPGNSGWHLDLICPIDQHTTGFHGALRMVMHDTASPDAPEIRPVWDKLNQGHAPFMPMANLTCCSSTKVKPSPTSTASPFILGFRHLSLGVV